MLIEGKQIPHNKILPKQVKELYQGHEVAAHTLTHPRLPDLDAQGNTKEIIRQVEQDRVALSKLCGYEVMGMAYPCGGENNTDRVADIIKNNTGIRFARTIKSSYNFELPNNLHRLNPTIYHMETKEMFRLADKFLNLQTKNPALFYIWGHSYEFDVNDTWNLFENFMEKISGRKDIFYGTNSEVLGY